MRPGSCSHLAVRAPRAADHLRGGATGGRRKPFAIVASLVLSFSAFTLFGVWLLKRLGLPEDLLRGIAIGPSFSSPRQLLFPKVEEIVQRPFLRLTRRPDGDLGGGLLLGASLGLVFVPCRARAGRDHRRRRDAGGRNALDRPHAFLRDRGGGPHALRRVRRPVGDEHAPTARAPHPAGPGRRSRADGAGDRAQRDRVFQTAIPGYTEALQSRWSRVIGHNASCGGSVEARAQAEFLAARPDKHRRSPVSRAGSTATR